MCVRRLPAAEFAAMRARLRGEGLITSQEAGVILDALPEIVVRWICRGRRGVRLEGWRDKVTGTWYTSRQACERFAATG